MAHVKDADASSDVNQGAAMATVVAGVGQIDSIQSIGASAIAHSDRNEIQSFLENLTFDFDQNYDPVFRKSEIERLAVQAVLLGPLYPERWEEESAVLHTRISDTIERLVASRHSQLLSQQQRDDTRKQILAILKKIYHPKAPPERHPPPSLYSVNCDIWRGRLLCYRKSNLPLRINGMRCAGSTLHPNNSIPFHRCQT
jgi:hypothetical protein